MRIGLVGLGRMGLSLALRLLEHDFALVAWDHSATALEATQNSGIPTTTSPSAVAEASDFIISIVTDDHSVRKIFKGAGGFLSTDVTGKLFIEMSTLQPMTSRELAPEVEGRGARFIESPVLGSIASVRQGTLLALAGGKPEDVERSGVLLAKMTRRVEYMGLHGTGYAMKLAVNLGMGAYIQAIAESISLGLSQGLTIVRVLSILKEAPYASPWLEAKFPVLIGGSSDVTLDIRTMRKDLMSALATGSLSGIPMPLTAGALTSFSAANAVGAGSLDLAEIARVLREHMRQQFC